jgi:hypothetical protein
MLIIKLISGKFLAINENYASFVSIKIINKVREKGKKLINFTLYPTNTRKFWVGEVSSDFD